MHNCDCFRFTQTIMETPYNASIQCRDIHDCLSCLALSCSWSPDKQYCAVVSGPGTWFNPGMDMQLCKPQGNESRLRSHDNWNNPVSLTLFFLLAILIGANILYLIRKVSMSLTRKLRMSNENTIPLCDDANQFIQRY